MLEGKENHPPRSSSPRSQHSSQGQDSNHSLSSRPTSPKSNTPDQASPRTTNFSISSILGRPDSRDDAHSPREHAATPKSPPQSPSPPSHPSPAKAPDGLKEPRGFLPPMLHPGYAGYFLDKGGLPAAAAAAHLAWYPWLGMAAAAASGAGLPGGGVAGAATHPYLAHLSHSFGFGDSKFSALFSLVIY